MPSRVMHAPEGHDADVVRMSEDFRKKNGWTTLKNFIAAIADPGTQPSPRSWQGAIGSLGSLNQPMVLNRRNGQYDIVLSSNMGSSVTGVTVTPPTGVTWSSVGYIDPAVGTAPVTITPSGGTYTFNVQPYPVIVRITP